MKKNGDLNDFYPHVQKSFPVENHSYYRISEIYKIPKETKGIYGWYITVNGINFVDYFKIFKMKKLSVKIKGNLREQYTGDVHSRYSQKDFSPTPNLMEPDLFTVCSLIFCPPIYIGISKDLFTRIGAHARELEKIYTGDTPLLPLKENRLKKIDLDSNVESKRFAQRLGHSLRDFDTNLLNSIFIKTLEMPKDYPMEKLRQVESYFNRTYIPIFGRK